jgi:hypothetical protein
MLWVLSALPPALLVTGSTRGILWFGVVENDLICSLSCSFFWIGILEDWKYLIKSIEEEGYQVLMSL